MGDNMEFQEIVKYVRIRMGYSQEQMARTLNVSFATVNRWENGKSLPRPLAEDALYQFCKNNKIDIKNLDREDVSKV